MNTLDQNERDRFEARVRMIGHLVATKLVNQGRSCDGTQKDIEFPLQELNYGPTGERFNVRWDFEGQWQNIM